MYYGNRHKSEVENGEMFSDWQQLLPLVLMMSSLLLNNPHPTAILVVLKEMHQIANK